MALDIDICRINLSLTVLRNGLYSKGKRAESEKVYYTLEAINKANPSVAEELSKIIHMAVQLGLLNCLEGLLRVRGINMHLRDEHGKTPMDYAKELPDSLIKRQIIDSLEIYESTIIGILRRISSSELPMIPEEEKEEDDMLPIGEDVPSDI